MAKTLPPLKIKNALRQPGLVTSAFLLNDLPVIKYDPGSVIQLLPTIVRPAEKRVIGARSIWGLQVQDQTTSDREGKAMAFQGMPEQIYKVYQYLFYEGIASTLYKGDLGLSAARDAIKAVPPDLSQGYSAPLLATTHKILLPEKLLDHNDYEAREGPAFSYYRQDWQEGLEHALDYTTKEEFETAIFQQALQGLEETELKEVYPSCFFATHRYADYGTGQAGFLNYRDAWDVWIGEPCCASYVTTLNSEEAMQTTLSILENGFITDTVRADPQLEMLQEFNSLHYELVCAAPATYCKGVTKGHVADFFRVQSSLS